MSDTATAADQAQPGFANGTFCWNELVTRDPEAARTFFGGLLGWTFREVDMGPSGTYTIIQNAGKDGGGMMKMDGAMWDNIPPHWMAYIAVDDVDACAARTPELGGTICVPPTDVPGVGRFCVINDPTGAVVSLMTFKA